MNIRLLPLLVTPIRGLARTDIFVLELMQNVTEKPQYTLFCKNLFYIRK